MKNKKMRCWLAYFLSLSIVVSGFGHSTTVFGAGSGLEVNLKDGGLDSEATEMEYSSKYNGIESREISSDAPSETEEEVSKTFEENSIIENSIDQE